MKLTREEVEALSAAVEGKTLGDQVLTARVAIGKLKAQLPKSATNAQVAQKNIIDAIDYIKKFFPYTNNRQVLIDHLETGEAFLDKPNDPHPFLTIEDLDTCKE